MHVLQEPRRSRRCRPACSCSARARYWGDLDDPESEVSKAIEGRDYHLMLESAGTKPECLLLEVSAYLETAGRASEVRRPPLCKEAFVSAEDMRKVVGLADGCELMSALTRFPDNDVAAAVASGSVHDDAVGCAKDVAAARDDGRAGDIEALRRLRVRCRRRC